MKVMLGRLLEWIDPMRDARREMRLAAEEQARLAHDLDILCAALEESARDGRLTRAFQKKPPHSSAEIA